MYKKEIFEGGVEGYNISWESLEKELDKKFPKISDNKWWADWVVKNWEKGEYNRSYIKYIEKYKTGKTIEKDLGYYDNINNRYITTNRFRKVTDVLEYNI